MTEDTWFMLALGGLLLLFFTLVILAAWLFRNQTPPCEHSWMALDTIRVGDPGEPVLAIIYVHRCTKCGVVTRDRVSNKQ